MFGVLLLKARLVYCSLTFHFFPQTNNIYLHNQRALSLGAFFFNSLQLGLVISKYHSHTWESSSSFSFSSFSSSSSYPSSLLPLLVLLLPLPTKMASKLKSLLKEHSHDGISPKINISYHNLRSDFEPSLCPDSYC